MAQHAAHFEQAKRRPNVEIRDITEDSIDFELSGTDVSVANALRRVMIAEVPTLAIERVEIFSNTSVLLDEFISHRLGMIPIRYTYNPEKQDTHLVGPTNHLLQNNALMRRFIENRDCDCEDHCWKCSVEFNLKVSYDDREEDVEMDAEFEQGVPLVVTSNDLVSSDDDVRAVSFSNRNDESGSQDKGISILKLAQGQEIHLKAIAICGIAKEHSKWSPVSACVFRFAPIINIDKAKMDTLSLEEKRAIVDADPTRVFGLDEQGGAFGNGEIMVENEDACVFCPDVELKANEIAGEECLTVRPDMSKFIFHVETIGSLAPDEVVRQGLFTLKQKLDELRDRSQELVDSQDMGGAAAMN